MTTVHNLNILPVWRQWGAVTRLQCSANQKGETFACTMNGPTMARSLTYASRPTSRCFTFNVNEQKQNHFIHKCHVNPNCQNWTASATRKTLCLHRTDKSVNFVHGNNSSLGAFAKHTAVTDRTCRQSVRMKQRVSYILCFRTISYWFTFNMILTHFDFVQNWTKQYFRCDWNRLRWLCVRACARARGTDRDLKTMTIWTSHPLRAKYGK